MLLQDIYRNWSGLAHFDLCIQTFILFSYKATKLLFLLILNFCQYKIAEKNVDTMYAIFFQTWIIWSYTAISYNRHIATEGDMILFNI